MADISKIKLPGDDTEYNLKDNRLSGIFYITCNLTSDSTNPSIAAKTTSPYRSTIWASDSDSITSYYAGLTVAFKVVVAGNGTYGTVLNINGLGYKPVVYNINSMIGTRYSIGSTIIATYNPTQTAVRYMNTTTSITETGCWQVMDYDSNTVDNYNQRNLYFSIYNGSNPLYRYKICGFDAQNKLVPLVITNQTNSTVVAKTTNTTPFRGSMGLHWYSNTTTISEDSVVGNQQLYTAYSWSSYLFNYTLNTAQITYSLIYIKGTYDIDSDMFTLPESSGTDWYVYLPTNTTVSLSDYFTTGSYYILAGGTYSSEAYSSLFGQNPIYYFDGTNLVPVSNIVNGSYLPLSGGTVTGNLTVEGSYDGTNYVGNLTIGSSSYESNVGAMIKTAYGGLSLKHNGYSGYPSVVLSGLDSTGTKEGNLISAYNANDTKQYLYIGNTTGSLPVDEVHIQSNVCSVESPLKVENHNTAIGSHVSQNETAATSAISMSSGTAYTVCTITLSAGTWIITGGVHITPSSSTRCGIGITSNYSDAYVSERGTTTYYYNNANHRMTTELVTSISSNTTFKLCIYANASATYDCNFLDAYRIA